MFPTREGNVADKSTVVAHIEAVALKLGMDIEGASGERLFGGHSLRVTGAQWMASLGIPLATIQLVARWSSEVVARDVGEAPLQALTSTYRRAAAAKSLGCFGGEAPLDIKALRSQALSLSEEVLTNFRNELVRAAASTSVDPRFSSFMSLPFVVRPHANGRKSKIHRVATRDTGTRARAEWHTSCGWKFGHTDHKFCSNPLAESQCRGCFRLPGGDAESEDDH